jgi:hypothetical protein
MAKRVQLRRRVWTVFLLAGGPVLASEATEDSWSRPALDFESGLLFQTGSSTPIEYRLLVNQLSYRSGPQFSFDGPNESVVVVRSRFSLLGTAFLEGPESHYVALSAAPSIEWWSPERDWSLFLAVGGGVGVLDSTDVEGGQGQDVTLNWFANLGMRYQVSEDWALHGGALFQHLSNGGATDPNPGIDVVGFSLGAGFSF